jgi:hypothetical protein
MYVLETNIALSKFPKYNRTVFQSFFVFLNSESKLSRLKIYNYLLKCIFYVGTFVYFLLLDKA